MAGRKPTGQLYENRSKITGKVTSYGVRFRYAGKRRYVTLEATTRKEAEAAMRHLMADVQRGLWTPPEDLMPEAEPEPMPTFWQFASKWYMDKCVEAGWRNEERDGPLERYKPDLFWRLSQLEDDFAKLPLDAITVQRIDRYRLAKVRENRLGASSINKSIAALAAVLEVAVEYEFIARNPAKGKSRRLKQPKPRRAYLDQAVMIAALLDAASAMDAEDKRRTKPWRRALLATLVFAGPRIDEALSLRWRHVDLAAGRLRIPGTKTEAALRTVIIEPALRDELLTYAADRPDRKADDLVFATSKSGRRYAGGSKHSASNIRTRVLAPAVTRATERLREDGHPGLPAGLTPHGLRRTYASMMLAIGRDLPVVQRSLGHASPSMTLGIYAQAMDLGDEERDRLRELVGGAYVLPAALATGSGAGSSASSEGAEPVPVQAL